MGSVGMKKYIGFEQGAVIFFFAMLFVYPDFLSTQVDFEGWLGTVEPPNDLDNQEIK